MSSEEVLKSPEDRSRARNSSPSITGRVRSFKARPILRSQEGVNSRAQSADSRRDTKDEYDTVTESHLNLQRPPSQSELEFREDAARLLNPSNPLLSRISFLQSISKNVPYYSTDATTDIIEAVKDLALPDATPKAREAVFRFIECAASTPDFSELELQRLFDLAIHPVASSEADSQLRAIAALTQNGRVTDPFPRPFVNFLNDAIRSQYNALSEARRRAKSGPDRPKGPLPEERGLHLLLSLVAMTIRQNPMLFDGNILSTIVQSTVHIAEKTTSKIDMKKAVEVLQTVIQYKVIPPNELRSCVEIFCAIMNAIPDLNQLTWDCLMLLLLSPDMDHTTDILLETLALAPTDRHSHTVCGALGVLVQLVAHHGDSKLPKVEFNRFIESLWEVHFASRRIRRDCLKIIRTLLADQTIIDEVLQCRWDHMIQIILTAVSDETYIHDRTSEPLTIGLTATSKEAEKLHDRSESTGEIALADDILQELTEVAGIFNQHWLQLSAEQRQLVGLFYYKLRLVLPSTQIRDLLSYLNSEGYFMPQNSDWQSHQLEMLRLFLWDREPEAAIACFVIQILSVGAERAALKDIEHYHMLVLRLLNEFESEMAISVANALACFARITWKFSVPTNLAEDLDRFWPLLQLDDRAYTSVKAETGANSTLNEVTVAFVNLFLDYYESNAGCASLVFDFLVRIAKSQKPSSIARLQACRLLVRLRCNENGNIMIVGEPDSLGLAVHLARTEHPLPSIIQNLQSDLTSGPEDLHNPRTVRTSTLSQGSQGTVRGSQRVSSINERAYRSSPLRPLWMYPGPPGLPRFPAAEPSPSLYAYSMATDGVASLRLSEWLIAVIDIIQQGGDWEIYSYILVHLPSQLGNPRLFADSVPHIKLLRNVLGSQLHEDKFQEAPPDTGVKKGDVATCLFASLTMLLAYSKHFARAEQDDMIRAFVSGISAWDRTPKSCIQALAIACHQTPASVSRLLQSILVKMSQIITQSHLSVDILEFLGGLARLPNMYINFREEEYRLVFAICVRYLEYARDQRLRALGSAAGATEQSGGRVSGISVKSTAFPDVVQQPDIQKDLPQYVFALTHHVITIWFLSLKITDRSNHVGWLTSKLVWIDQHNNEIMEEQSQVTLDMMHRTAYLDLGETVPTTAFTKTDGRVLRKTWLVGMSIVTIETAGSTGLTQITKRQASGTTYASYQPLTASLPPHHVPAPSEVHGVENQAKVFPNHILLQLASTIAPVPTPMEPICLPEDEMTRRAITYFDRNDTVDGYKIGVIYIAPDQTEEVEILANTQGSRAYTNFLEGLGTKVRLRDANFNTQGLDRREDADGEFTYAWRDRIAELVFHVTTMMPTDLQTDPQCINKKRHIGNDFVKIIFNESGRVFEFDTISSQFNYVNIVITPEAGCRGPGVTDEVERQQPITDAEIHYYTIQTVSNTSLPPISPCASSKLLALSNLPALARHLALHSAVFSNVWVNRDGGEHVSSWRNRLREITRLRERFANTGTSASTKFPGAKGSKTYAPGAPFHGRVDMGGLLEDEGVLASLDFSRWAGANHTTM